MDEFTDDTGGDAGESDIFPDCPRCGTPVVNVTVVGPTDGIASPCGCEMPPGLLVRDS